jgi:hypothetical protein
LFLSFCLASALAGLPVQGQPGVQSRPPEKGPKLFDTYDNSFVRKFLPTGHYLPISEIQPGMVGWGLSVFEGTKVERFGVKVIGVVKKVLNGRDAILVRMSGAPLANNNVIKGMSGSPVYIDGKLIGAISFGFDFSKEPIAGITPIVDMLDAMATDTASQERISQVSPQPWFVQSGPTVNVSGAAPRLVPLMSPVALAGFSSSAQDFLSRRLKRFGMTVATGAAGGQDPGLAKVAGASIVPGGSVSVLLSTGDFNVVATGTVTARFGQKVLAFGHPFLQAGAVDFPLATAYVHDVLPSLSVSFKLASPVQVVGVLNADRPWSVGGQLGRSAQMIPATFKVTDKTRHVKRTYHCQVVDHPDLTPDLLASTAMSAIDATHQSSGPYVARVESVFEAQGVEPIKRTDRFSSNFSVHTLSDSGSRFRFLGDPVGSYILRTTSEITNNDFVKASIKKAELDITLEDGHEAARLDKVYIDKPFVAPGELIDVHCLLKPYNGKDQIETLSLRIPREMPDGNMLLGISSGDEMTSVKKRMGIVDPTPESLKQVCERIIARGRGDAIELVAALPEQSLIVGGVKLVNPPAHWARIFLSNRNTKAPASVKGDLKVSKVTDWLIDGSHILTVEVRSPEKVVARQAPYTISVPNPSESITTTEQARKTIDASRKSSSTSSSSSSSSQNGAEKSTASGSTPPASATLKEYPHMRPAQVWRQDSDEDFRTGKTNGTTIDSWGRLSPGFQEGQQKSLGSESQVWSGVWSQGSFWFGTADKIFRWSGDESMPELVAVLGGVAIPAMCADSKGTIYAASVPGGKIWALETKEKPRLLGQTPEPIVTSMCVDDKDNLYVGTAGTGKIYRYRSGGIGGALQEFFSTAEAHVLSLFYYPADRRLYVGCGESGVVLAVDQSGSATTVYQAADHFVTGAVRDAKGDLYVSTAGQGRLVRVMAGGEVQTLATSEAFYKLYYCPYTDSVFSGDAEGDITLCKVDALSGQAFFYPVCHTEQEEVLALASDSRQRLFAGTANLGMVRSFDLRMTGDSGYESAVHDAGKPATWIALKAWGALNEANEAIQRQVRVETRSGESGQPDMTWSGWQEAKYKDGAFAIASAPARYLQYRLKWSLAGAGDSAKGGEPAKLGKIEVSYLPKDSAPKVSSVSVKPGMAIAGKHEVVVNGSDPDSDNLLLNIDLSADGGKTWKSLAESLRSKHTGKTASKSSDSDSKDSERNSSKSNDKEDSSGDKQKSDQSKPVLKGSAQKEDGESEQWAVRDLPQALELDGSEDKDSGDADKHSSDKDSGKDTGGSREKRSDADADKDNDTEKEKKDSAKKGGRGKAHLPSAQTKPVSAASSRNSSGESTSAEEKISWTFDTAKHKDGNYIMRFKLDDRLSSPDDHLDAVALRAVTLDNKPPEIGAVASSRDVDGRLSFTILVKDQFTAIANAIYRIDEGEPFALSGLIHLTDGMSGQLGVSGVKVGAGQHKVEVKVTDSAGNTATKSFNVK